jgi:hypothetical protein
MTQLFRVRPELVSIMQAALRLSGAGRELGNPLINEALTVLSNPVGTPLEREKLFDAADALALPPVTKRFFDTNDRYTEHGHEASNRFEAILWGEMMEYAKEGFSLRELYFIIATCFGVNTALIRTIDSIQKHKPRVRSSTNGGTDV